MVLFWVHIKAMALHCFCLGSKENTGFTLVLLRVQRELWFYMVLLRVSRKSNGLTMVWKSCCFTLALFNTNIKSYGFTMVLLKVHGNNIVFTLVLLRVK